MSNGDSCRSSEARSCQNPRKRKAYRMKQKTFSSLDPELLQEIKKIHFQTRRSADRGLSGSYRSAFRGRGIEFEEVREYFPGDDVRAIDWNVTARSGIPHIKTYREERELAVILAVDVSASTFTGTRLQLRESLIARVGAMITLIALRNNDKVGLVTYSDQLESYHPPRKARSAVWRILHEVMSPGEYRPQTDLAGLFIFLRQILKRRALVFVLSDFICPPFEQELALLSKRHEINLISVGDPIDTTLPNIGLFTVKDPETGLETMIDSSDPLVRSTFEKNASAKQRALSSLCARHGIDLLQLQTNEDYMHSLRQFFSEKRPSLQLLG